MVDKLYRNKIYNVGHVCDFLEVNTQRKLNILLLF